MKLDFKLIKKRLIKELGESIIADGFLFNKKSGAFQKGIPGGVASIYLSHLDYQHRIFFQFWWGVSMDRISAIYNSVTEKAPEYFDDTQVFCNSLGPLMDYVDNGNRTSNADNKKYLIVKDEDVPVVVAEMVADIHKYIIPYFEQNYSVERANELLNRDPTEMSVHCSIYPYKIIMGLIAARLTRNADYDHLVSIYDPAMEDAADNLKREYDKLKVVLAKM